MIAGPLSATLIRRFATPTSVGVAETFVVLGSGYLLLMLAGAFAFRVPPEGWRPAGFAPAQAARRLVTQQNVLASEAIRTPQFYLLWGVLFLNVTAGIGVLGQASAMIQEVFRGRIGVTAAAGFVGLLSLFNMAGRFAWSSASDRLGRKTTYTLFFTLGPVLYATVPFAGRMGNVPLFVACLALVLTMYGGGFATIPAYLADLFGTRQVGAIHGRLLTAWSAAGIAGPVLVNYLRQYRLDAGVDRTQVYGLTMYLMASLLVVGLACNLLIKRVDARHHAPAEDDGPRATAISPPGATGAAAGDPPGAALAKVGTRSLLVAAWAAVLILLGWGVLSTLRQALLLFG
jgi:hypothetical protein